MHKTFAALAASAAGIGLAAVPAAAQPEQNGLVNVYVEDVTVQVPVSVALNLCDVNISVLVDTFEDDAAPCHSDGGSIALTETGDRGSAPVRQGGLVNVALTDVTAQIPIALAATLCNIDVAVLVGGFEDAAAACEASGVALADA